jgi:hypothetical protein
MKDGKMFDNVNLYKPDKIIRLSELRESGDIYDIMRKMSARDYAYGFAYVPHDELRVLYIKLGMSSPNPDRQNDNILGERVVRQASHLLGWSGTYSSSTHGLELFNGLSGLVANGEFPERALHKNNIIVGIWNAHPNFRTCQVQASSAEQAKWLEAHLCAQYKNDFKLELPPLNIADPSKNNILTKTWPAREVEQEKLFAF